jgi:uncharacterized membrane protein YdjX (TVP38/TMEM64 family)
MGSEKNPPPRISRGFLVFLILFAALTALLCVLCWPLIRKLRDPGYREAFSAFIRGLGFKGLLIVLGVQVLQVFIAVIPGEPVELLAGAAYGALGGLGVCLLGCILASSLIFLLVRKFRFSPASLLAGRENLRAYRFLRDTPRITRVVFLLFLIPGTPKDMLTYLVPFSGLGTLQFIVVSSFARIPSIVSSTIMGDSLVEGNWTLFLGIFLCTAGLGFLGIIFRERIVARLGRRTTGGKNRGARR